MFFLQDYKPHDFKLGLVGSVVFEATVATADKGNVAIKHDLIGSFIK